MRRIPSIDGLEPRLSPCVVAPAAAISDPTIPRPPTEPTPTPDPPTTPEPDPGPFPGADPPIVFPPPPVGGPVGPG
jgi:hypothetical protein